MRVTRWNRGARLTAGIMICLGATMVTGGVAASAPNSRSDVHAGLSAIIYGHDNVHGVGTAADPWVAPRPTDLHFDDQTRTVTFTVPTPPCPRADRNCQWLLWMNEPKVPGQPAVAMVTGTSGVLTLDYPAFCGIIQADVLIGPVPWDYALGRRRAINTCPTPTTTTTTSPTATTTSTTTTTTTSTTTTTTSTTTTTVPKTTTTTTLPSNVAAAGTGTPPSTGSIPNGSSALPFTAATITSMTTAHLADGSSSLPFTGTDVRPLALLGSLLILIGSLLLMTVESRRRALMRATTLSIGEVKDGARKTAYWFLGE